MLVTPLLALPEYPHHHPKAMLYFAKDIGRLDRQKQAAVWDKFPMKELKESTLGVLG